MTHPPADVSGSDGSWIWALDRDDADTEEVTASENGVTAPAVVPAAPSGTSGGPSNYELPAYLREPDRIEAAPAGPGRHHVVHATAGSTDDSDPAPAREPGGEPGSRAAYSAAESTATHDPVPGYPAAHYPGDLYPAAHYPGDLYPAAHYPGAQYPAALDPTPEYPGAGSPGTAYPAPEYSPAAYPAPDFPTQAIYPVEPLAGPPAAPPAATQPDQTGTGPDPAGSADFGAPTYVASAPAAGQAAAATPRPEALLLPEPQRGAPAPASWGWRGRLRALSGGLITLSAGPDEMADRDARRDIQRSFSRPMTVVVISPKGGAGKTPTTIGLAAALGTHRGGYVVGWDDNETRGTLAVRVTNPNRQRTTVWDLLGNLEVFERTDARVGDFGHYVRSQGDSHFDALVSDDSPANMAQIGDEEFHRIHAVLERFYRQIIIDTGNNVRSLNWQAAVNAADLVVVVSTYQRDVGYSGSWVLDHLTETGREQLANDAVTVLTASDPKPDPAVRAELLTHFGARTQAVVEIPFDPVIALGGPIEWSQLKPATRRAWTKAGAAIINVLSATDEKQRVASR